MSVVHCVLHSGREVFSVAAELKSRYLDNRGFDNSYMMHWKIRER